MVSRRLALGPALIALLCAWRPASAQPLPSWNDGAAKARIVEFVRDVTDSSRPTFVPVADRVAVFDNDGTLWSEKPYYHQLAFMLDVVKAAAPSHPEWKDDPAFVAIAARDMDALEKLGKKRVVEFLSNANAGMTTEAYDRSLREWLAQARDPRFHQLYPDLVYQPMRELLAFLRDNAFTTYIVSGGGIAFMRPWVRAAYGVAPEQVVGTVSEVVFKARGDSAVLERLPGIEFVDDGPGKPVGIYRAIGRRPIAAFGNSDGDLQMLQYVAGGSGARLAVIVHHTDAEREWAYDRDSKIGHLDKALDAAVARRWVVVDMKRDWAQIFSFQPRTGSPAGR